MLFSTSIKAQTSGGEKAQLKAQRDWFIQAERFADKPTSVTYQSLRAKLEGYPLTPYLDLKALSTAPYLSNQKKIDVFLQRYQATPLEKPLRKRWLRYLAKQGEEDLFLKYYQNTGDTKLACQHLHFLSKRQSHRASALKQAAQLWLVGHSQPKECDPVFALWQQHGLRTQAHVWQRLKLAADGGKHTLIPYLKGLLPKEQGYLADLWLKVRRSPAYVARLSKFPGTYPKKEAEILAYGLSRLVWKDRDLALKTWESVIKGFTFNQTQQQKIANKFAVALAIDNHEKAGLWLERANKLLNDKELFRWHLAHVLRQRDWQHVLDVIALAPSDIAADNSYRYWRARAYEQMQAIPLAQQGYSQLAEHRHYYGFLASGQLAQSPRIVDKPLTFSEQELASVASLPGAKRAYEFLQLKQYTRARREWVYLRNSLDARQKLIAAVLADNWNWHDQAIFTFANAGYMDDVKRRFPMAHNDLLLRNAEQHNIDPAWAFAIVRRESSFMLDANSRAGAKGLMQLMPGTARYLAKKKVTSSSLYDPAQNVQFGTQYLRYLMDKMNDNPVLATASYNAGWRRVKSWLPTEESQPVDVWIETIPYRETRNYVKAVLAYRQIYAKRLGQPSSLFENLANMQLSPELIN